MAVKSKTSTSPSRAATSGKDPGVPRSFRFPSAFTVLFAVTIAVWVLAFVVPTGRYASDPETGAPVPGS